MAEKTEQPTPKKLRDAREKGQVATSKDFASALLLLALAGILIARLGDMKEAFTVMLDSAVDAAYEDFELGVGVMAAALRQLLAETLLPVLGVVMVTTLIAYMGQIGPLFAFKALKMDIKRLNPVENGKNMFGKRKMLEFLLNVFKTVFLGALFYHLIVSLLPALLFAPACGMACIKEVLTHSYKLLMFYACLCFLAVGLVDLVIKRKLHIKDLMMTKDEVKREFKEMEGDPFIKGKRRQLAQEMAMNNMSEKVKKASVIVTNPTHRAVALFYNKKEGKLPVVVAKGEDHLARLIIKTAEKEGIPIMRNVPLAHALYDECHEDQYIPSHMIEAVAAVLRWLQQIKRNQEGAN